MSNRFHNPPHPGVKAVAPKIAPAVTTPLPGRTSTSNRLKQDRIDSLRHIKRGAR